MRPWALLSLLCVSAAWDTSVVHKGLFTQPFKPRDRNAAYAIDIVPYTDAPADLTGFNIVPMSYGSNSVNCYVPTEVQAKPAKPSVDENVEKALGVAVGLGCLLKMIDGVIYEVCTGKRVKVTWEGGRTVDALPKRTFPPAFHSGHAGNVSLVEFFFVETELFPVVRVEYHCVLSEHYTQAPPIPGNVRAHIAAAEVNKRPSGGSLTVLEIHHRDAALCSLSASSTALVASMKGSCPMLRAGWWNYELCINGEIKQFHSNEKGEVEVKNSLGRYQGASGEVIAERHFGKIPAIMQLYSEGTICDLTQTPRKTMVRYECAPDVFVATLKDVQEVSTCVYEAVILTNVVCDHPALAPEEKVATLEPVTIQCMLPPTTVGSGTAEQN